MTQAAHDMEKRKVEQRDQRTFDAEYQLVAVQQELDSLRSHVSVVEEEREALKTSLKEEEVARIAAEGMIALPHTENDDDLISPQAKRRSPMKRPMTPLSDDKENVGVVTKKMMEARQLTEELRRERMMREKAEGLVDFLRLECHFRCCPCASRRSSKHATMFDTNPFAAALERIRSDMREVLPLSSNTTDEQERDVSVSSVRIKRERTPVFEVKEEDVEMTQPEEPEQLDRSMTMDHEPAQHEVDPHEHAIMDEEEPIAPRPTPLEQPEVRPSREPTPPSMTRRVPLAPSSPPLRHAPKPSVVRTVTTTTTIPMHFTPQKPRFDATMSEAEDDEDEIPTAMSPRDRTGSAPTFDREAALAAIAYRRGRAKSLANGQATPRKQMLEGVVNLNQRRDISAPALGQAQQKSRGVKNGGPGGVGSAGRTR